MAKRETDVNQSKVKPVQRVSAEPEELQRAARPAADSGPMDHVTCRAGDDSCAKAHATRLNRTTSSSPSRAEQSLLQLQKQYGNRYVERVLTLARQASTDDEKSNSVPSVVETAIQQQRGHGQDLDSGVRRQMEGALGADFSGVRVHTDTKSDSMNNALSARAFTTGQDIFFSQGAYQPGSSGGRELIAHELTHVVQQDGDKVRRALTVSQPGDPHEVEAEKTARAVTQMEHHAGSDKEEKDEKEHTMMASRDAATLQRQPGLPDEEKEEKKAHASGGGIQRDLVSSLSPAQRIEKTGL
jgi:hypothetical protein